MIIDFVLFELQEFDSLVCLLMMLFSFTSISLSLFLSLQDSTLWAQRWWSNRPLLVDDESELQLYFIYFVYFLFWISFICKEE